MYEYSVYGCFCVLGAFGTVLSFWKHGNTRFFGLSYFLMFVMAVYFLVVPASQRQNSFRFVFLIVLGMLPGLVHMLLQ